MRRRPHEGELGRGGGGGSNLKASPEDEHASETSETRRARRRKRTRVTWNDTRAGPTILTIHYKVRRSSTSCRPMAPSFFLLVPPQRAPEQHVSDASHRRRWRPPRLGRKSGSAPRCAMAPPPRVRDGEAFAGAPSRARCNPKIAPLRGPSDSPAPSPRSARPRPFPSSRAGVPHLGGHRRRRHPVHLLLHPPDDHLSRLPVRASRRPPVRAARRPAGYFFVHRRPRSASAATRGRSAIARARLSPSRARRRGR